MQLLIAYFYMQTWWQLQPVYVLSILQIHKDLECVKLVEADPRAVFISGC